MYQGTPLLSSVMYHRELSSVSQKNVKLGLFFHCEKELSVALGCVYLQAVITVRSVMCSAGGSFSGR